MHFVSRWGSENNISKFARKYQHLAHNLNKVLVFFANVHIFLQFIFYCSISN
jgi:hypothetical protein